MGKLLVFYLILRITGNPFLAIIVILAIYYFVDRRYIGLLPSIAKPFQRQRRMSYLRRQVQLNPHDTPAKHDLAEAYIEVHKYQTALSLLESLPKQMQGSAEILYLTGLCHLNLEDKERGESLIIQSLEIDKRLNYGEPYLRLAAGVANTHPDRAVAYLNAFQQQNVSSCESYYRMGKLQQLLGNSRGAQEAWRECLDTYRMLPRFRKRRDRRWAIFALFRVTFGGRG
ncbi:tetratricopeptide repeat protein [Alicyclobacillus ferrooxydans]|uniref:Uncharacterized protein n=1 Tax=Alicyclobacillus ferrooxydans TaxID=471514 RepID=A0A0P9CI72_9BACL|nr:tetratricopeptide repeat protein [Alicyclobacillus ferrooxydans]KPV42743.1 hypothetical protein AN477_15410 [Alicyclobacillus ferrooxydans]